MKLVWLYVALFLLAGCTGRQPQGVSQEGGSLPALNLRIEYIDENNTKIPYQIDDDLFVVFRPVPGYIFGPASNEVIYAIRQKDKDRFRLIPHNHFNPAREFASELEQPGLKIVPQSTNLVRVGTFVYNAATESHVGQVGFLDNASRDHLILMYFDQPNEISGIINNINGLFTHRISIKKAGFHWIRIRETGDRRYLLTEFSPVGEILFSIFPHNYFQA